MDLKKAKKKKTIKWEESEPGRTARATMKMRLRDKIGNEWRNERPTNSGEEETSRK